MDFIHYNDLIRNGFRNPHGSNENNPEYLGLERASATILAKHATGKEIT